MRRFVPMNDDLLYRAGGLPGRLVPYRAGLDCWHALGADGIYRFEDEAPGESAAALAHAVVEAANDAPPTSTSLARQA